MTFSLPAYGFIFINVFKSQNLGFFTNSLVTNKIQLFSFLYSYDLTSFISAIGTGNNNYYISYFTNFTHLEKNYTQHSLPNFYKILNLKSRIVTNKVVTKASTVGIDAAINTSITTKRVRFKPGYYKV